MKRAIKVANDGQGRCDNCGKDLKKTKWVRGESTGCTKKCADAEHSADMRELSRCDDDGERNVFYPPWAPEGVHN